MKRYLCGLILGLLTCSALYAQRVERDTQIDFLVDGGQYLEAVAYCAEMAGQLSGNDRAGYLLQQGDLYLNYLDLVSRAKGMYARVLDDHPASFYADDAAYNLGMIAYQAGKTEAAIVFFQKVIEAYPKSPRQNNARFMVGLLQAGQTSPKQMGTPEKVHTIRVLLTRELSRLEITGAGGFELHREGQSARRLSPRVIVQQKGNVVDFAGQMVTLPVVLRPLSGHFVLDGRTFSGSLVVKQDQKGLLGINQVDLETYVKGVVAREMGVNWPAQALMAQAVASRTYAVYQAHKRKDHAFDVRATTSSQVYGGVGTDAGVAAAVDATRGQVLMHEGHPILAYFHSHSGGYIEDDGQVFPVDLPYLNARKDDFSPVSEKGEYAWRTSVAASDLVQMAGGHGALRDVQVSTHTPSGRVARLTISWAVRSRTVDAARLRLRLDPTKVKSTWFEVYKQGDRVIFEGRGYGHGVGMSQWGAKAMAKTHDYIRILSYFYPGTEIISLTD